MKKKTLLLLIAVVLIIGGAMGGTLAWLVTKTNPVTNTFTTSNIDITLEESTGNEYKMVPGHTIAKDPKVTVLKGSEPCYLFVKLEKSANFDDYLFYEMAADWTRLSENSNIYYRKVLAEGMGIAYSLLNQDEVTVKESITKADMSALNEAGATKPILTITAYASQLYKDNNTEFDATTAWSNISDASNSSPQTP
ncbi:MAG: hypothetical protein Q4D97_02660 [Eubacteriales bacterium]|nr:hypothetical protein [Eubacteriales bacterium]